MQTVVSTIGYIILATIWMYILARVVTRAVLRSIDERKKGT